MKKTVDADNSRFSGCGKPDGIFKMNYRQSHGKDVCVDIRFTFRARILSMKLCTELHAYIIYESTALIHC